MPALKHLSPFLSENKLAELLFQAPSRLLDGLPLETAREVHEVLRSAGLDCEVIAHDEPFTPGDTEHELAIVVHTMDRIAEIIPLMMQILGIDAHRAKKILFTSPTVLIGNISESTATALTQRFAELDVEVDISRPARAAFDLFLGTCSDMDFFRFKQILQSLDLPPLSTAKEDRQPLIAAGLTKTQADTVWQHLSRSQIPIRLINRDFERFDLQLDQAPESPEMITYLVESTGMPERLARKILGHLPIVLHQNFGFDRMQHHLQQIHTLGGAATAHLLLFQTFSLTLEKIKNARQTIGILQALADLSAEEAQAVVGETRFVPGPLTNLQARWLEWELKKIGTETQKNLR